MQHQLYLLRRRKPKQRVYKKLPPEFASDYIKALRVLSRKHRDDDADEVTRAHRLLKVMSREALVTKRGELWIPSPDRRTGYYPIIEKVPYTAVRTMLRKNTSEKTRDRARGVVAASAEPFVPLFARRPGTLNEAQRRSFLAHIMVALPWQKGRHPAFLGKRVPGELSAAETGTRSVIPIHRLAPEDWEKGFTMRKFSLSEDLAETLKKRATRKPRVTCPTPHPPQLNVKETLKRATALKVALEPEQSNYILSTVDRMCYEDGFRTRMAELKQQTKRKAKRAWRWIRGEALPAVARGATLGVAELAETELGMGPTTIDLQPVRRISLKPQYQPYPSSQLRSVVASLQERLVQESDPVLRKGLEKSVSELATELAVRSALL